MTTATSKIDEALQDAKHLAEACTRFPAWLAQVPSDDSLKEAEARARALLTLLAEIECESYPEPTSLEDVPRWIGERPQSSTKWPRPWWGASGHEHTFACDGHAMLLVRGTSPVCLRPGWDTRELAEAAVERVFGGAKPHRIQCPRALLERAMASPWLALGPVTLDGRLLDLFVRRAITVQDSSAEVLIEWGERLDAVRLTGSRWRAILMPYAADRGELDGELFDLLHELHGEAT